MYLDASRLSIQGVPKVRSSNFMRYNFSSKLNLYMKFVGDVYCSIDAPFFITFSNLWGMEWDTVCRQLISQ